MTMTMYKKATTIMTSDLPLVSLKAETIKEKKDMHGVTRYYYFDFQSPLLSGVEFFKNLCIEVAELKLARRVRRGEIAGY